MNPVLATIQNVAVLAQTPPAGAEPGIIPSAPAASGLPAGPVGSTITVTLLFGALVIAFFCVKIYKSKLRDIALGTCIGVLGATGFVGSLAWALIGIGVKLINALASTLG